MISPNKIVLFLGKIFDFILAGLELPEEKLQSLPNMFAEFSRRKEDTKTELQKLVGHMSFAYKVVHGARPFTGMFITALPH